MIVLAALAGGCGGDGAPVVTPIDAPSTDASLPHGDALAAPDGGAEVSSNGEEVGGGDLPAPSDAPPPEVGAPDAGQPEAALDLAEPEVAGPLDAAPPDLAGPEAAPDAVAPDLSPGGLPDAGVEAASPDQAPPSGRVPGALFQGTVNAPSFAGDGSSWSRAIALAGGRVVTANPEADSITVLGGSPLAALATIPVGDDPRTVAVTPDGRYAATANRGDATVSVVDLDARRELYYLPTRLLPYGVVIAGGRIFVSEWATGEVAAFDPVAARLVTRAPVGPFPAGIAHCGPPACALAGGRGLLVTHFFSGQLSRLDPATLAVVGRVDTGRENNLSQHVSIAPDGRRAYLPLTLSAAGNPMRAFNSSVFPVLEVVDLASFSATPAARIVLDQVDAPVAMPFAADFLAGGTQVVLANAASDDLLVVDLSARTKVARFDVGANPQALAVTGDGASLLVNEVLDGTLRVIPTANLQTRTLVPLAAPTLPAQILRGKRVFWNAQRGDLARDRWMSCASCHFDGFHDARTWRSFPDGVRNTTAIFDIDQTMPLHWSGDLDEPQDVEATVHAIQEGTGLSGRTTIDTLGAPLAGVSPDLDALAAYMRSLRAPPSPYQDDVAGVARGQAVFARLGCATCHAGPALTDQRNHDVGTGDPTSERNSHGRGVTFDTPSLRLLWMTAPYLHDGQAATLDDVFIRGTAHNLAARATAAERADLVTYLRSL